MASSGAIKPTERAAASQERSFRTGFCCVAWGMMILFDGEESAGAMELYADQQVRTVIGIS